MPLVSMCCWENITDSMELIWLKDRQWTVGLYAAGVQIMAHAGSCPVELSLPKEQAAGCHLRWCQ